MRLASKSRQTRRWRVTAPSSSSLRRRKRSTLHNQYLHEKKRIHKLYSIIRERAFFEMVVKEDVVDDVDTKDIKLLQFEPVL